MLLDPNNKKNVLEILYETGFNSKATFNRVFKKVTGLSPTEYKKKFAGEGVLEE
jgi:AraC-like DNA-binding protein